MRVGEVVSLEEALRLVEARRQKVLANPSDPSWTEHFAELQNELRDVSVECKEPLQWRCAVNEDLIELRWLRLDARRIGDFHYDQVLQYRTRAPYTDASGAVCGFTDWGAWRDVQVIPVIPAFRNANDVICERVKG
jgi:hypothetical protein